MHRPENGIQFSVKITSPTMTLMKSSQETRGNDSPSWTLVRSAETLELCVGNELYYVRSMATRHHHFWSHTNPPLLRVEHGSILLFHLRSIQHIKPYFNYVRNNCTWSTRKMLSPAHRTASALVAGSSSIIPGSVRRSRSIAGGSA